MALLNSLSKEESPAGIDGIAYRTGSDILLTGRAAPIADVDSIPLPARHLLDMKLYLKDHFRSFGLKTGEVGKIRSTNLITSRGCPYSCTFCFKEMWGSKWRGRSPESILAEMASLHETYGVNGFYFNDDTFVLDRDRVLRFCRLLQERGLKAIWYCNGRVNLMSQDMLREMYRAGCRGIAYGIESGNQQVLDSMRKNIKLDQVRQVIEWTKGAGINVTGYFMIGMLGETKDTIRETIAFARELQLDFYGFSITTPLPGTELFETSLGNGLISGDLDHLGEWSLHANSNLTQDCSLDDLRSFASEAFREFTVRKRFGKYYMLRPDFALAALKILLAVRGVEQAREVAGKARGLLASYWSKPEA